MRPFGSCLHLGLPTGRRIPCPGCPGNVQRKEFACALAQHPTTVAPQCRECVDYEALPTEPAPPGVLQPCSCTAEMLAARADYCPRMGRVMVGRLLELCREREDYREAWETEASAGKPAT